MILDLPLQAEAAWAGSALDIARTAVSDRTFAIPRTEKRWDIISFIRRDWEIHASL